METKNSPKLAKNFYCEKCDYKCSKESDYKKHLSTRKHKMETNGNKTRQNSPYICECGIEYKTRSGLFKHKQKQKCKMIIPEDKRPEPMLEYLLKENIEMKKILVDVCQKLEPIGNNTINSSNNIVNINMFLNEQCKDAMNMTEFIESIQLSLDDMMNIATTGQTQGMTSILIDRLSSLDVLKRPLHCSDLKKETIYIKDEDKWEQDSKTKPKMKSVLDKLTKKGIDAMPIMEDDPDNYVKTITEVIKEPREDKKIINSVIKEVFIN